MGETRFTDNESTLVVSLRKLISVLLISMRACFNEQFISKNQAPICLQQNLVPW